MALSSSPSSSEGFTAIPRTVLDMLLCLPLSKRDLAIILLVARLTYGCRHTRWAHLKQADLAAIGIGPTNAGKCLRALLTRNLLLQNGTQGEYRINETALVPSFHTDTATRLDRLMLLVGHQLQQPSHFDNPVIKKVSGTLPKREDFPYQKDNVSRASDWSFDPSRGKFEKDFDTY